MSQTMTGRDRTDFLLTFGGVALYCSTGRHGVQWIAGTITNEGRF